MVEAAGVARGDASPCNDVEFWLRAFFLLVRERAKESGGEEYYTDEDLGVALVEISERFGLEEPEP